MRVHFQFGDAGPDLLLDNLVRGFAATSPETDVTWWPDKPWIHGPVPILNHPMLQCYGGQYRHGMCGIERWGSAFPTERMGSSALMVVTHSLIKKDFPQGDFQKVAIDAYDKPLFDWCDAARRAGYVVFARENVRKDLGEHPISFCFNPLWVPSSPSSLSEKMISVLVAGDDGVGRRKIYAEALKDVPGVRIAGRMAYGDWQIALTRSKAVLVAHGAGRTTYRLSESAAAGCAPIIENLPDSGYVEEESALFFEPGDVDRLRHIAWRFATDPLLGARIGEAAKEVANRLHTPVALAKRILKTISK